MNRSILSKSALRLVTGLLAVAALVAACGGSGGGLYGNSGASGTTVAGSTTVLTKTISGQTVLVAGSKGMTLYTFDTDVSGSGQSACNNGCAQTWPPLTVSSGTTPTAGTGASGSLGTITRSDGSLQVTYNGLPLHFYVGDQAPGDTNGHYPGWSLSQP